MPTFDEAKVLKAAEVALQLAEDVEAGKVVPLTGMTFNENGPCCILGHLFARCGVGHEDEKKYMYVKSFGELVLGAESTPAEAWEGTPLDEALATIWITNDNTYHEGEGHEERAEIIAGDLRGFANLLLDGSL